MDDFDSGYDDTFSYEPLEDDAGTFEERCLAEDAALGEHDEGDWEPEEHPDDIAHDAAWADDDV